MFYIENIGASFQCYCISRFHYQEGATGVTSVRRLGAALCWAQQFPAGSVTNQPGDSAEPISQGDGALGKVHLMKIKTAHSSEELKKIQKKIKNKHIRNSPANTKIREEGRETGTPGTEAHSLAACVTMLFLIFTLQPTEDPMLEQVLF